MMNIRELEDKLFEDWLKKYPNSTFTKDGCPNLKVYLSQSRKFVFVLKDSNLGNDYVEPIYDLRHELETTPHMWWKTIAIWGCFLQNSNETWLEVSKKISSQDSIKEALSHYCFMQLKKESGGGRVYSNELYKVAEQDKREIIQQLCLYRPDFVIACGNGDQLSSIFGCSIRNRNETSSGVGYWEIDIGGISSYLIDYCHPSIRVGTKVSGLIAQGLSKAVSEIENSSKGAA